LLRANFALKDSHCYRFSIIDFTGDEQLMSVYVYILMTLTVTSATRRLTNENEE